MRTIKITGIETTKKAIRFFDFIAGLEPVSLQLSWPRNRIRFVSDTDETPEEFKSCVEDLLLFKGLFEPEIKVSVK